MKHVSLFPILAFSALILFIAASLLMPGQNAASRRISGASITAKVPDNEKTLSPYFLLHSDDPTVVEQFPLKSSSAEVNIAGVIASVKVSQEYSNNGKSPIEAIYVFPASVNAAVYSMKMTIGERTIEAKIAEKEKARKDYEEARNNGQNAALLEEQRPNVFQMNVANIMPGDLVKVELCYTETLIPEENTYRFIFPTIVGPRYSNKGGETTDSDSWVKNPYMHEGTPPSYKFNLNCEINAGLPIAEIQSPSHNVKINYLSDSRATVSLDPLDQNRGNKDLILEYRLAGNVIQTGMLLYPGEKENFFLAMIQPPKQVRRDDIPPREYIFIVDVSGSMNGFPISISKKLMKDLLGNLKPTDRFNIILFAGGNEQFRENSVPASEENISLAESFIDKENGGGGTELLPALKRALNLKGTEEFARSFIIATDGYVDIERQAFDLVRNNRNKANFFAFGIGTAVNRYLIEGIAKAGGGMPFIITDPSGAGKEADKFRKYVESPVLTHINLKFDGFEVYDIEPSSIQDVFADRPVLIYGKYKGNPSGSVLLKGISAEGVFEHHMKVSAFQPTTANMALRYLWARERISILDDYTGEGDGNKEEVTRLGLTYNLLTRYTSFVAIDSKRRNEGGSITVQQPLPLPEGVSDLAVGPAMLYGVTTKSAGQCRESMSYEMKDSNISTMDTALQSNMTPLSDRKPQFPGGEAALKMYIKQNINYPETAKKVGLHGKVKVRFTVGTDGKLSDIKVIKGIGGGCDEEAIELIKSMPAWNPGVTKGKFARMNVELTIDF